MNTREPYVFCFSGGRSSAYALYLMREELTPNDLVIFNNTGKENEATLKFVKDCGDAWNISIIWLEYDYDFDASRNKRRGFKVVTFETASRNGEPFELLLETRKHQYLPNRVARYCTENLKIVPTEKYLQYIGLNEYEKVLGMRYDEPIRYHNNKDRAYMPLYEKKITKEMVRHFWAKMPFDLQLKDYQGNCDLCPLKGMSIKLTILAESPEKANWWVEQENKSALIGSNGTFTNGITVAQILENSKKQFSKAVDFLDGVNRQGDLFGENIDETIQCFCGD